MRCTGHCCRSFRLSSPLAEVRREQSYDAQMVAAMVIPLGRFEPGARLPDGSVSQGGDYYDCRHLGPNGDCAIYVARPQMCRECPKHGRCEKPGCTLSGPELEAHMQENANRELREQRRLQDHALAQLTHDFDISAQDTHSKSERAHFAVVGEGSRSAMEAYRANYETIDWRA